jgi:hypothetical protein
VNVEAQPRPCLILGDRTNRISRADGLENIRMRVRESFGAEKLIGSGGRHPLQRQRAEGRHNKEKAAIGIRRLTIHRGPHTNATLAAQLALPQGARAH